MDGKKIIIIDDRPLLRDAWSYILESNRKYAVVGKYNKSPSLANIVKDKKPDLVILDISIKQLFDFPFIRLIRKFSPDTKIVAISLQLEEVYAKKLFQAGANAFITADCSATDLQKAVESVIRGEFYLCHGSIEEHIEPVSSVNERVKNLTKRELEVLHFVRVGLSSKQIASKIAVAPRTVDVHRRNILKKLNLRNSTALVQFAHATGL